MFDLTPEAKRPQTDEKGPVADRCMRPIRKNCKFQPGNAMASGPSIDTFLEIDVFPKCTMACAVHTFMHVWVS